MKVKIDTLLILLFIALMLFGIAFLKYSFEKEVNGCLAEPLTYGLEKYSKQLKDNLSCSCAGQKTNLFWVDREEIHLDLPMQSFSQDQNASPYIRTYQVRL